MTGRGVAVSGGLAALGLAIAYGTWQREPERATGEAVVLDVTKGELTNVHFEDEANNVDLQPEREGGEAVIWLRVQEKPPAPPPKPTPKPTSNQIAKDASADASPAPKAATATADATPPPKPKPVRQLRGDEPAEKLLAEFAPFRSPRAFGVLDAKKLKELGLDTAKKKLAITARGETRQFVIGQPAQGSGEAYLRDVQDGRVYMMPRQVLTDLQGASYRLVDRKLHVFKIPDINRLVVTSSGKKRDFLVKNPKDPVAYQLAPVNAPDKPEQMARNWHDKIWRLYPMEVFGKGEVPPTGQPKVVTRIEYFDGSKSIGWIELGKLETAAGTTPPSTANPHGSPTPGGPETFARTEHTAGWVRLHSDPSTLTDADRVAAGS